MTEVQELKKEVLNLTEKFKQLDKEIHLIKHNSANVSIQIDGIYVLLKDIEKTLMKYDGNKEIGFDGKFKEMQDQLSELSNQNKILMEAYEIGKTWKIKLSGFFLALATLASLIGATFGVAKGLVWVYEHLIPNK